MSKSLQKQVNAILSQLTLDEKLNLLHGKNMWEVQGVERLGVPSVVMSDGPHGVRHAVSNIGNPVPNGKNSLPAVCFPTASAMACSFDDELLFEVGKTIGTEAKSQNVNILLGPGVNHKRSPLGGRNFEYFSEDPRLTGILASNFVNGVQSVGVGACVKHYALNSQEYGRVNTSSNVDRRAMFELYLNQFRYIIKHASPWAIMPSYNKVLGTYACENDYLLNKIGREKLGFDGCFISDWGAVSNVVESFKSGLNIEMPSFCSGTNERLLKALHDRRMTTDEIDKAVLPILMLALKSKNNIKTKFDKEQALKLSQTVAEESAVLLKNNNILPLKKGTKIAVIGDFAKSPRIQGAGSSLVNAHKIVSFCDALDYEKIPCTYAKGYDGKTGEASVDLINEAKDIAKNADVILIVAGLPGMFDQEGTDRETLDLPSGINNLITEISNEHKNTVVVLQSGSSITLPFINSAGAVLWQGLSGCMTGPALLRLLWGIVTPSGKLAETFPLRLEDTPCDKFWHSDRFKADYTESIYSGYRYYDTTNMDVLFPFGWGLSYTTFEYKNLKLSKTNFNENDTLTLTFTLKNTGNFDGAEIVQVYTAAKSDKIFLPQKTLAAFKKVNLKAEKSTTVNITLDNEAFSFYNEAVDDFTVLGGTYQILVGSSSRSILLKSEITVSSNTKILPNYQEKAPHYFDIKNNNFNVDEFYNLCPEAARITDETEILNYIKPYNTNTPIGLLQNSFWGKIIYKTMQKEYAKMNNEQNYSGIDEIPIRFLTMGGGDFTKDMAECLASIASGKIISGTRRMKQLQQEMKDKKQP